MISRLALVAALAFSGAAFAQPAGVRLDGSIVAVDPSGFTLKAANGTETKILLGPDSVLVNPGPSAPEAIKPGTFVATANLNQPDGTGRSTELRLIGDGVPRFPGSQAMPQGGMTMTDGNVTKVAKTAAGHEIDVEYPGGTRHILVPANVRVADWSVTDRSALKPGVKLMAAAEPAPGGAMRASIVVLQTEAPPR